MTARRRLQPPRYPMCGGSDAITAYLQNGGTLEKAQQIACHDSPRTTTLYERSTDTLTLDKIERITL